MNMPVISIIVPVYNVEKYIHQCIDSILLQTFTDFEVLLVDDGASDHSGSICDEYAHRDSRIRVFHQENAGVSVARNKGLCEAIGEYVTFVDSDDWIKPDYLKELYKCLLEGNRGKGLILGSFEWVYPTRILPVSVEDMLLYHADFYRLITEFICGRMMYVWGKLFNRELIISKKIAFIPDVSCFEDMLFVLDYCCYADYILIKSNYNYCYRVSYSTDTLSSRINSYECELSICKEFLLRLKLYQDYYAIADAEMQNAWKTITVLFHKVILAIYCHKNQYSYSKRIRYLRELTLNNRNEIKRMFLPAYLADKIAKYLLLYCSNVCFDIWMRFLYKINFRRMFGHKTN